VSTGGWIVPEIDRRLTLIGGWEVLPDFAGVNFHEPRCSADLRAFAGEGRRCWKLESGTPKRRTASGEAACQSCCLRILIEPGQESGDPKSRLDEIEAALQDIEHYNSVRLHN
jgi:hypothetical protein